MFDTYNMSTAIANYSLGFQYSWNGHGAAKRLHIHFGWDQLVLFGQNQLHRFSKTRSALFIVNQGDLGIKGIEIGAQLDF